ncbi:ribosome maturation factor RimM (plasmid) [Paraburkholderia strydomiana]|uniref:ribosome maturation factor RimM n=1 Tax=Paraburkholderia TaxID=1822464 RepID=UPI000B48B8A5|nr:ribosome maturation factor RimM [uncultured Paraburkholderia sp.]OWJ62337.1 ribosome maturation factor RimM [Burkholderia sp. Bk]CAH2896562.1 MAG: 16S rRNA processing protein RimM [uncultured Paraburkholderia sp.]CAH2922250.1 MAG: 16S rRNA processing protein RimM [uncultured Paraburkholderia sp.]
MSERDSGSSGRVKAKEPTQEPPKGASSRAKTSGQAPFGAFVRKPVERTEGKAKANVANAGSEAAAMRAETAESWPADAVEVGAIVDAYGLKGWVKVAAHADAGHGGDALLSAKRWWLMKGRERQSAPSLQAKTHSDSVVAHLGGVTDRDAALSLRGSRVYISRSEFPALEADEFYWVDLLGLDVVNLAGVNLGKVADMIDNGAHSVLRVEYAAADKVGKPVTAERLIPFVGVFVKTVDQAAKQIIVDWEADY